MWPPPVLPINRTDATYQQGVHPGDHNAANLAINDIVPQVQSLIDVLAGNVGRIVYGAIPGGTAGPGGNVKIARGLNLPAGAWAVLYTVLLSSDAALNATLRLYNVSSGVFDAIARAPAPLGAGTFTVVVPSVGGGEVSVDLMPASGAGNVSAFSDSSNHSLIAIGLR